MRTPSLSALVGLLLVASGALAAACGSSGASGYGADGGVGLDGSPYSGADGTYALGKDSNSISLTKDAKGSKDARGRDSHAPPVSLCGTICITAGGHCVGNVCELVDNPAGISSTVQQQLQGTGAADSAFVWLYPYDATVFPRGLISPTLQFGGIAPDAMLVHVTFSTMDYKGYFGPSSPTKAQIPATSWTAITETALASDVVKVNVTKLSGGQVTGPVTERWTIAQGSLRGQIYYETYMSALAEQAAGASSPECDSAFGLPPGCPGIMSIAPGAATPTVLKAGCGNVCHTASADGSTLVANVTWEEQSASYDLKNNAATLKSSPSLIFTYGGLYPDGSFLMSATDYRGWAGYPGYPGAGLGSPSRLYDTKTGSNIPAPGWDSVVTRGGTTAFSPDGKFLAFIHEDTGSGHTLGMVDFAVATKTFSNLVDVATDPSSYLGWPAFTPDSQTIVYHAGSNAAFETDQGATGNIYLVNIATKKVTRLDALDGYSAGGSTYLPTQDPDLNFAPTVLPEAVGGYFWAVFTSHRSYGNILPTRDNSDENGKLWVAAIDLGEAGASTDRSHPAFYLDGQESAADNLRGFWVLPPCKAKGDACASGDECCTGYCRGSSSTTCVSAPPDGGAGCSNEYEKCTTSADCCDSSQGYICIGGFCAQPAPPR